MSELLIDVTDGICTLTLNRPARRNALSNALVRELVEALEAARDDDAVRVVVITGSPPAFCAGADLGEMEGAWSGGDYVRLLTVLANLDKPSIAKVRRYAIAGGLGIAASCHFAYCDEEAFFLTPEVHRGIWPMMIMAILFRVVPRRKGLEMMILGERVGARQAEELGLVNRAVPADQLDAEVEDLARRLATLPATAVRLGLRAYHRQLGMDYDESLVYLQGMLSRARDTADAREGLVAFLEGRKPRWQQ